MRSRWAFAKSGFFEGLLAIAHAVGFQVGFGDHVKAIFVAEVIPEVVVGVMAGADSVDVVLLHDPDVLQHAFGGEVIAAVGVHLMPIDPFDEDGLAVDEQLSVLYFYFSKSNFYGDDFL